MRRGDAGIGDIPRRHAKETALKQEAVPTPTAADPHQPENNRFSALSRRAASGISNLIGGILLERRLRR